MKTLLLFTIPLLFTGCLSPKPSPKSQYYLLQPDKEFATSTKEFGLPFLIIGPVDLSPYLDQPKIAVQVGEHEIAYQEYHRWAEAVEENVASVLADNLRQYFQTPNIGPGAPKILLRLEQSRVLILINRMDLDLDGNVSLSVQWAVSLKDKNSPPKVHLQTYTTKASSEEIPDQVSALNQLVNTFSLDLAKSIEQEF